MKETTIADLIDIDNEEHKRAVISFYRSGKWPPGFLPVVAKFPPGWEGDFLTKVPIEWAMEAFQDEDGSV